MKRKVRLEKVVASKHLRFAVETEEERRATKRLSLALETKEERKARLEKVVATAQLMFTLIKGLVDVGVVLSLKLILKSWQLCLSFKFGVLTT